MSRASVGGLWLAAVVLLGLGGARLWRTLGDPAVMLDGAVAEHWLYTGDFLYPALFWQERADGLPVRGTAFSGAVFACPELLVYGAVWAIAPRPAAAVILWHFASMGLAVAAFAVGLRTVAPVTGRRWVPPLVLLLAAGWCGWVAVHGRDVTVFELLLPMYHVGSVVNGLGMLVLLAGWLRGGGNWRLAAAGLLTAAAVLSDRLVGPWVIGPLVAALGVTRLLVRPDAGNRLPLRWRGVAAVTLVLAAGAWAGLRAIRWLCPDDPIGSYFSSPQWGGLLDRGLTVVGRLAGEARGGNPALLLAAGSALVSLGVLVRAAVSRRDGVDRTGPVFLAAFGLAGWAGAGLAVALSDVGGLNDAPWPHLSRYFLGPTVIGCFAWAVWLAGRRGWLLVGLAAGAVGWAVTVPRSPTLDLLRFRPPYLEKLDAACRERGLTHGLAGFWLARPATVLSDAGVRVDQVMFNPEVPCRHISHLWLSHPGRFWAGPGGPPRYQFVLVGGAGDHAASWPNATDVIAGFGRPAERVPLGGCELLVYGRPGDTAVREFAERDAKVNLARWKAKAGGLRWTADQLRPPDPSAELMACGPYFTLDPGWYKATFRVTATAGDGPVGWVDVVLDEADGGSPERWLAQDVRPGFDGELSGVFEVKRKGPQRLVFRASSPAGRLTLREVQLDRLP